MLSFAGLLALKQCRRNCEGRLGSCSIIDHRRAHANGWCIYLPVHCHDTRKSLYDDVVRRIRAFGTRMTKAGEGAIDKSRV